MIKKLLFTFIFCLFAFPPVAFGTTYYIDFTNGKDTNTGLGTTSTTAFQSINQFANNARSAGDTAYVRRDMASTTNVTAVTFTSDGTLNNPISISADYDDLWDGFTTLVPTATPVFGSTAITVSASSTAVHNSWIYFGTDCSENATTSVAFKSQKVNPCEYAYEVASSTAGVANTVLTLFLPYKGPSTGAGVSIRQMGTAPQVGVVTLDVQIFTMANDDYWYFKGLDLRSTSGSCVIATSNSRNPTLYDAILQGDGVTDCSFINSQNRMTFFKSRFFGQLNGIGSSAGSYAYMTNFLIDCNNVGSSIAFNFFNTTVAVFADSGEIKNCTTFLRNQATNGTYVNSYFKNVKRNNVITLTTKADSFIYFEDDFATIGLNSQTAGYIGNDTFATTTIATTTVTRSGGGPTTQYALPPSGTGNTGISTNNFPYSYIKLFEYPIYANTSSKTYTMYFMATSSTAFNINPLTSTQTGSTTPELYIECEYYNATSGADRFLKRSNTASAFTADGTWDGISVTCQPTQTGILYLRGWYGKPHDGKSNWFFMDTTPTII